MNILHVHSMYSRYDSPSKPDDIVARAKEIGANSVTLTDHGTMLGIEPFMDAGKKYGINTIPGVETYCENRTHLIIVARNFRGYLQISRAMRDANEHIESGKGSNLEYPIMTDDILRKYFTGSRDVIATSACIQGPAGYILRSHETIDRSFTKLYAEMQDAKGDYELFTCSDPLRKKLQKDISDKKKRKKDYEKYLRPSYAKKIERLKKKVEREEKKGNDVRSILFEIEASEANAADAPERVKRLEEAINKESEMLKKARKDCKKSKSGWEKYRKAEEKMESLSYPTKAALVRKAAERLDTLRHIFPFFYAELQYHGLDQEKAVMPAIASIARKMGIPVIAANDAHITEGTDDCVEARRILRFNYFQKAEETRPSDRELYMKTEEEMRKTLGAILPEEIVDEAIRNTDILDTCRVEFPEGKHYPSITRNGLKPEEYFDELLEKARVERIQKGLWNDEYQKRLEHEVQVIKSMGFVDYHLVVRDFCIAGRNLGKIPKDRIQDAPEKYEDTLEWIRQEGFDVGAGIGPGRGSACGSLVCNMLGITGIDPIKYDLLFERFLNPERVSMPDIDTDVSSTVRPILIRYIKETYGERAVCSIATVTTYSAKSAVQMAGRDRAAQLYPGDEGKDERRKYLHQHTYPLSDLIPEGPKITLSGCEPAVMQQIQGDAEKMLIWKRAKLIEGCLSGTGVHAGGVIISDNDNVNDYIPLAYNRENSVWVAQCDMVRAEEKGLLKMDLLGLNTLDIITDCLNLIKRDRGESLDISALRFEPEIFRDIYATGNTNSVFQFESPGMKSTLKKFRPERFDDIILLNAAFRPGPMQYLDGIIEVKNTGKIKKSCLTEIPELKEILAPTYMSIIYQEQVMKIFQKLAGYSLGGADLVRRFMSKKKTEKLKKERKAFIYGDAERHIKGCVANGISEKLADELFDQMMEFAKYAFNKSHACAYSYNSYITAYLKYHYPVEFLCAMFNNKESKNYGPIIEDCQRYGIKILPPSLNASSYDFTTENGAIRFGFRGIAGMGGESAGYIDRIVSERRSGGPFTSVGDFLFRCAKKVPAKDGSVKLTTPSKSEIATFAESGSMDSFIRNRSAISSAFPKAISVAYDPEDEDAEEKARKSLRTKIEKTVIDGSPADESENIKLDFKYTGMILSCDPLEGYEEPANPEGKDSASVLGILLSVETAKTSKGNDMAVLNIMTRNGFITARGFEKFIAEYLPADRYICAPVVVSGSWYRDGVTARSIRFAEKPEEYLCIISTCDAFERVGAVVKSARKGNKKVTFVSPYTRKDGQIIKRSTSVSRPYSISTSDIERLSEITEVKKFSPSSL